jgi:hypothetical protein
MSRRWMHLAVVGALVGAGCSSSHTGSAAPPGPRVLLVGTYKGHQGQYLSIQAAVDAAQPGDWILVAPGDYHEGDDTAHPPSADAHGAFGGVLITTAGIHLRGMDRPGVIVDGTKPGPACSSDPAQQSYGAVGGDGKPVGRNGIVVSKANGVSVENLTVCNFLSGSGASGNGIWWNGGADSGTIGLTGYTGRYLTATTTFFSTESAAAAYGIFSSNAAGSGVWDQVYASNFNDSGMYVGACLQQCAMTISHARMEYNALGYSGTNSGGSIVIQDSEFDHNKDGFDTNTQIGGDPPAPQDGACPGGAVSPLTHMSSCWVFMHNSVHDNNNADVPNAGSASAGPTGTGMTISGGEHDTVIDNQFSNNGAWGVLFVPYPDSDHPSLGQTCAGTGGREVSGFGCVYDPAGDALLQNTFVHNGFFGNLTNGDFGQIVLNPGRAQNCFSGNVAPDGSAPANLEQVQPTCGPVMVAGSTGGDLLAQVLCDTGFGTCPAGAHYPKSTAVVVRPLPTNLPTLPNPCDGVPANPWCAKGQPA